MPRLDHSGPEGKGPKSGRGLGNCSGTTTGKKETFLGKGLGKRRKSGGGEGLGKRFRSGSNS